MALNAGFTREIVIAPGRLEEWADDAPHAAVTDQTLRLLPKQYLVMSPWSLVDAWQSKVAPACPISASSFWTLTHALFAVRSSMVKGPWCCASVA
jgi:hypothetical protein